MSPKQPLPRSYKRKYYKLLARFAAARAREAGIEAEIAERAETATKLEHEIHYLLDTVHDLDPARSARALDLLAAEDDAADAAQHRADEVMPAYFADLPWDLNREAVTGSLLEDKAAMQQRKVVEALAAAETPARANGSSAPAAASRKRERDPAGSPLVEHEHGSKKRR